MLLGVKNLGGKIFGVIKILGGQHFGESKFGRVKKFEGQIFRGVKVLGNFGTY